SAPQSGRLGRIFHMVFAARSARNSVASIIRGILMPTKFLCPNQNASPGNIVPKTGSDGRSRTPGTPIGVSGADFLFGFCSKVDSDFIRIAESWGNIAQKPAQTAATGCLVPRSGRLGRIFYRHFAANPARNSVVSIKR